MVGVTDTLLAQTRENMLCTKVELSQSTRVDIVAERRRPLAALCRIGAIGILTDGTRVAARRHFD